MKVYPKHMRDLDMWHSWMIKVDLYQYLKLSPTNLLYLKGWFGNFCNYNEKYIWLDFETSCEAERQLFLWDSWDLNCWLLEHSRSIDEYMNLLFFQAKKQVSHRYREKQFLENGLLFVLQRPLPRNLSFI